MSSCAWAISLIQPVILTIGRRMTVTSSCRLSTLTASDVLPALRARHARDVREARVLAAALALPLLPDREAAALKEASAQTGTPLTVGQEYGPRIAREVEELERENEVWLHSQRDRRKTART